MFHLVCTGNQKGDYRRERWAIKMPTFSQKAARVRVSREMPTNGGAP